MATDEYPLVIARSKTITLGSGSTLTRERASIAIDIKKQGVQDVASMVQNLVITDTQEQVTAGNPPTVIIVDGQPGVKIEEAKRKATVVFGTVLAEEAINIVEQALRRAISSLNLIDTGALINLSNWVWLYRPKGGSSIPAPKPLPTFSPGDQLILYPANVPHASWANWRAKAMAGKGFMAQATAALRKMSLFRNFSVVVVFSSAHAVPGDDYPHGTPMIVIRPRSRRG